MLIQRWFAVAAETESLLTEVERLMFERHELYRKRAELLRDIACIAGSFVDQTRQLPPEPSSASH